MAFSDLKKKFSIEADNRFPQLTDMYNIPIGWENDDRPSGRVYLNPIYPGVEFYSATTILNKIAELNGENKWLELWRDRVGDDEADKISNEAKHRGTELHTNLEDYVENRKVVNVFQRGYQLFEKLKPWLDEHLTAVVASESALASPLLKVAGRVDLVGIVDGDKRLIPKWFDAKPADRKFICQEIIDSGVETVVDFKSSRKIKKTEDIGAYYRQLTIYQMLFEHTTGIRLEMGEILMGCDNNNNPVRLNFEVVFGNFRETVIDELGMLHEHLGSPINVDECKEFFCA